MLRLIFFAFLIALSLRAQDQPAYELPPIKYTATAPHDLISNLKTRLQKNLATLGHTDRQTIQTLLAKLKIPIESQVLVFSKTSLQRSHIRPEHPRAIFYTDTAYAGWVPGGFIEVTTIDPVLGPIFYEVDPAALRTNPATSFVREQDCLRCHGGVFVRDIPGLFVRSLYTDEDGEPLLKHGSEIVTHTTPFSERWGGWYVTGKHGSAQHRGNYTATEKNDQLVFDPAKGANITNLDKLFPRNTYLAPGSDIISLLVLEYQTAGQNVLTHAAINTRRMMDYQKNLQQSFKEKITDEPVYESVRSVFDSTAREIVDTFLYKDEAELPASLAGDPAFQRAFQKNVPRSEDGFSLKDFSLQGHLFQNRCSYLIYTETFVQLPKPLKARVYRLLKQALSPESIPRYYYLSATERGRIARILYQTHPEFKAFPVDETQSLPFAPRPSSHR